MRLETNARGAPELPPACPGAWTPEEKLRLVCASLLLPDSELRGVLAREEVQEAELRGWRDAALRVLTEPPRGLECSGAGPCEPPARKPRPGEKTLAETRALLALSWRRKGLTLGGRGRLHPEAVRREVLTLIQEALSAGARSQAVCHVLGLSLRTIQRWRSGLGQDRRGAPRLPPANSLSEEERRRALALVRSEEYRGLSPKQLVARLADQGRYVASESTLYRLRRLRSRVAPGPGVRKTTRLPLVEHVALAPNQLWSWDITYLKGPVRGGYFYLYLILDVFSRRIMGWQVHAEESMELSSRLILQTCEENGIHPEGLTLHSDNGGPMRGATMLTTLRRLGITPSFSRPRVSDDNPFSEALFRTLKGRPTYPAGAFSSLERARAWVERFISWYNGEHLHSGIGFVTPNDRYDGLEAVVLARRRGVYEHARRARPERWSRHTRRWETAGPVRLRALPAGPCLLAR
ncbi:MAG TPA: IS3 family transposase [Archangium sp.]|nr:IS3 family transposase [Archangium sp.]